MAVPADSSKAGEPSTAEAPPAISVTSPVPLVIGVTGHRDLVAEEIPRIREMVRGFLRTMQARFPDLPLVVMSALAEGADRLVAAEARAMGLPLIVPLPMPRDLYVTDFVTNESREEFEDLLHGAEVLELPILDGSIPEAVAAGGTARDHQYAQLGVFLCAHCHILLALWDGKPSDQLGGTASVVSFHHWDVMPGFTETAARMRQLLADDESDLVYHIVCSRDREEGEPAVGMETFATSWYTTDADEPRTLELPARYEKIFRRSAEFNSDAARYADPIRSESWPLITEATPPEIIPAVARIDAVFRRADWLAMHFQKQVIFGLRATYTLVVLMGLAFIAYADLPGVEGATPAIWAFLGLFAAGVVLSTIANRRSWHRKYLDYRALAEGLRVQFYWAMAGARDTRQTKFAHDNFLQKQDVELGWIRNVMRVTGRRGELLGPAQRTEGLACVMREWVDGQLAYYQRKSEERTRHTHLTERIGSVCLWGGIAVTLILAISSGRLPDALADWLLVLMGILPLIAAVREAYAHKKAERELIKQYQFMGRIFANARRKLDLAADDDERRAVLKALGDAALDEHAEWIMVHRERPLEHGGL